MFPPNDAEGMKGVFSPELEELLGCLGAEVEKRLGLSFPENRRNDLWHAVRNLARETGEHASEVLARLAADPLSEEGMPRLVPYLTVGETYFFRERKTLQLFRDEALPALARASGKELRVWCAGCSTGEEVYTLAMLAEEKARETLLPTVRILGTDLNDRALEKARRGVYAKWSFRGVSDPLREQYFRRDGDGWSVRPRFREHVAFAADNLAEDEKSPWRDAGAVDAIFCRNVLIYFARPTIRRVLERFHRLLASGGWLFVASCEVALVQRSAFVPVFAGGITAFRKMDAEEEAVVPFFSVAPGNGSGAFFGKPASRGEETVLFTEEEALPFSELVGISAAGERHGEAGELPSSETGWDGVGALGELAPGESFPEKEPSASSPEERALDAFRRGEWDEAESLLSPLASRSASARVLLVRIEANRGRSGRALELCRHALDLDREDPVLFYLLSLIHQERGEDSEEAQALRSALYLDPDFAAAHYALGALALRSGRAEEARRHFRNASALLARVPEDSPVPEMEDMSARGLLEAMRLLLR